MASEAILRKIPGLSASADLSAKQFHAVKMSGNHTVVDADAGELAVGVLQNDPLSGQAAEVACEGVSKVKLSAIVTAGAKLASDANGAFEVAGSGDHVVAIALEGGAVGDVISALLKISAAPLA